MNMQTRDNPMFSDDEILNLARSVEAHDFERIDPPAQVWNNVLAELEVEVASQEANARRQSQSWFSSARLLSAAAVVLLMVGITVAVVATRGSDDAILEVASTAMTDEGLPVATNALAQAVFECEGETCFIDVELTELPQAGDADLELWVINGDVSDMHSLGLVTAANGRFELPEGVTVDGFPIVDISIEPDDGDETHSGQSVLRGVLEKG